MAYGPPQAVLHPGLLEEVYEVAFSVLGQPGGLPSGCPCPGRWSVEPEHAEVVARLSEGRYLARCSCNGGTYHLHWDAATFRLTPEGLTFLAQVLEDLLAQGNDEGAVWLGSVGLRFRKGEGWGLLRLLRQGLLPGKEPPRALLRHLN